MVYRIADLYIEINSFYDYVHSLCSDYRVDTYPRIDFSVTMTREAIIAEKQTILRDNLAVSKSVDIIESYVVYREICKKMLEYDAFLMHGALIEYENRGYLFTAKSGTGKTTHINLWRKVFGEDKVTIVNGDKPLIRFIDGKIFAYGTPWCGKEQYNENTKVELCAIAFVERDENNSVAEIPGGDAFPRFLSQIMVTDSPDLAKQLDLLGRMIDVVPSYLLKCNMDDEAAIVSYNGLKNGKQF